MSSPLFGLVLAGGASTRMQRDKAALAYHDKPQLEWTYQLLTDFTTATFVSVRPDQREETLRSSLPQIVDRRPGLGPIAGIEAALLSQPEVAWLVVACDLPFITRATLQRLTEQRDARRTATAFRSAHDHLPEPLCAIWEPHSLPLVVAAIEAGRLCPRKLLIGSDAQLLDLPQQHALDNVNTSAEFAAAQRALHTEATPVVGAAARTATIKVHVQYFALLREQAGRRDEVLNTTATTAAALYSQLRSRYRFTLAPEQLKVAINADFRDWMAPLIDGDTVVFIPPVAGG